MTTTKDNRNKLLLQYVDEVNDCHQFKSQKGILRLIKDSIDFYEYRQWPASTPNTATMPRPVINKCKEITDSSVSNILSSPVKINFVAQDNKVATDFLTQFCEFKLKEADLRKHEEVITFNAEEKGTGIWYVFFDELKLSRNGKYKGSITIEDIDPRNIFMSNPDIADIEKQEWITIKTDHNVNVVREWATNLTADEKKRLIVPNGRGNDYYDGHETTNDEQVSVFTRLFKKDGETYFVKFTENCILHEPICMNPLTTKKHLEKETEEAYQSDKEDSPTMDSELEDNNESRMPKFNRYPIVRFVTEPIDRCFFGMGITYPIIPSNKLINLIMSLQTMNVQNVAWGKILVKKGALVGQEVNATPGQVLIDNTPLGNWGITNMPGQQTLSNGAVDLVNIYSELLSQTFKSNEVITSDMLSKNLSGTAIAQVTAQLSKNVERKQKALWRAEEDLGEIIYLYFSCYYTKDNPTSFPYKKSDKVFSQEKDNYQKQLDENNAKGIQDTSLVEPSQTTIVNDVEFNSINQFEYDICCEAGAGSQFSEIMQMQLLDNLLAAGHITFDTYTELYPQNQMPFKQRLKQAIDAQNQNEVSQWKQAYQELQKQVEEAQYQVSYATQKANSMEQYANSLKKVFKDSIDGKNVEIDDMKKFMATLPADNSKGNNNNGSNSNIKS